MYESHFGFSGSPFQLNPDPAFYFDSRGHSNALAYLKFGAHQGEGFIVVTGEIGAGKTTLVRTLLEGLNPDQVVAAQVVSTQLESSELLQAILMAFGVASSSTSKAHLIASLEAFLTGLAAKGRRALLIIDEAQNLRHEAVEELRMLSNFQLGKYGLLQSFLVGQPELRGLLQSKSMEQLRQRVIASCHLGPLDQAETRAYIEHRLRRVGWNGETPKFEAGALDRIHYWTGGVPRKINRQCNRMLLGAFLANASSISLALVDETATELRNEIGEVNLPPRSVDAPHTAPATTDSTPRGEMPDSMQATASPQAAEQIASGTQATAQELVVATTVHAAADSSSARQPMDGETRQANDGFREEMSARIAGRQEQQDLTLRDSPADARTQSAQSSVTRRIHRKGDLTRPLVCLVNCTTDYLEAGALQAVFEGFPSLPGIAAVRTVGADEIWSTDLEEHGLPLPAMTLHLGVQGQGFAARTSNALDALDGIFDELDPSAVMVMGSSDADLACAMLANKRAIRIIRVGSGQRPNWIGTKDQLNAVLIERIADLHFTDSTESFYALYREGVHLDSVRSVGNLTKEVLTKALSRSGAMTQAGAASPTAVVDQFAPLSDYGLVDADTYSTRPNLETLIRMVPQVCAIGNELPLIWSVRPELFTHLVGSDHGAALKAARVTVVRDVGYLSRLSLLERARCLFTLVDGNWVDAAAALSLPTIILDSAETAQIRVANPSAALSWPDKAPWRERLRELFAKGRSAADAPEYWHTGTASRIAGQLVTWMSKEGKPPLAGLANPSLKDSAARALVPASA